MTHRPAYPDGRRRPPLPRVAPKPRHAGPAVGPTTRLPDAPGESTGNVARPQPDLMAQAHRDLAAGLVDTDMHASGGLDAARRAALVPGAGGRPPVGAAAPTRAPPPIDAPALAAQKSDFTEEGAPPPGHSPSGG